MFMPKCANLQSPIRRTMPQSLPLSILSSFLLSLESLWILNSATISLIKNEKFISPILVQRYQ